MLKGLQLFIEGSYPGQGQVQRAYTLTNVLDDLVRVLLAIIGIMTMMSQPPSVSVDVSPVILPSLV